MNGDDNLVRLETGQCYTDGTFNITWRRFVESFLNLNSEEMDLFLLVWSTRPRVLSPRKQTGRQSTELLMCIVSPLVRNGLLKILSKMIQFP